MGTQVVDTAQSAGGVMQDLVGIDQQACMRVDRSPDRHQ